MMKHCKSLSCCCLTHFVNLRPLGLCVDSNEIHLAQEWSSKVNMHSLPGLGGPRPGVQWCRTWCLFHLLRVFGKKFYILIQVWTADMSPYKSLHSDSTCTWVIAVKLLRTAAFSVFGMITHITSNKCSSTMESSVHVFAYCCNDSGTSSGQPLLVYCSTLLSSGSFWFPF